MLLSLQALHLLKLDDLASNDCEEDRYFRACLPVLSSFGVTDLSSIPCLVALLKNLHLSLKSQYAYEEVRKEVEHFVCRLATEIFSCNERFLA